MVWPRWCDDDLNDGEGNGREDGNDDDGDGEDDDGNDSENDDEEEKNDGEGDVEDDGDDIYCKSNDNVTATTPLLIFWYAFMTSVIIVIIMEQSYSFCGYHFWQNLEADLIIFSPKQQPGKNTPFKNKWFMTEVYRPRGGSHLLHRWVEGNNFRSI